MSLKNGALPGVSRSLTFIIPMPELPEVETVASGLKKSIMGLCVSRVDIPGHQTFRRKTVDYKKMVVGRTISRVARHGKFLVLDLGGSKKSDEVLLIHLGMTGRLEVMASSEPLKPHTHLVFSFQGRNVQLRYRDVRRFGWLEIVKKNDPRLQIPDALTSGVKRACSVLQNKKGFLKNVLLDQHVLAGLGNIYVDEILHRSGLHPRARMEKCSPAILQNLCAVMNSVLAAAVRAGGTSFRDYVNVEGKKGRYSQSLKVYGRKGLPCSCGAPIQKIIVAARGTHFCPVCQPRSLSRAKKLAMASLN